MADTKTAVAQKPMWVDLSSTDAEAARNYYSKVFGWKVEVNPDPQYGGYGLAKISGKDVAGIGPKMEGDPGPSAWTVYIGSHDVADTVKKVEAAGGKVLVPPMDVGDQGKMVIAQDPSGAVVGVWQAGKMAGAQSMGAPNTFGWAELNARGVEKAKPFYKKVFGWNDKKSEGPADAPPYWEFNLGGDSFAGGMEMNPMVPAEMPSYWLAYFSVDDVDKAFDKAIYAGGKELMAPDNFPGGRFAIVSDPTGAVFGLLNMKS
jgi:predicted enzyme related to lactoylglutathione lyase